MDSFRHWIASDLVYVSYSQSGEVHPPKSKRGDPLHNCGVSSVQFSQMLRYFHSTSHSEKLQCTCSLHDKKIETDMYYKYFTSILLSKLHFFVGQRPLLTRASNQSGQ